MFHVKPCRLPALLLSRTDAHSNKQRRKPGEADVGCRSGRCVHPLRFLRAAGAVVLEVDGVLVDVACASVCDRGVRSPVSDVRSKSGGGMLMFVTTVAVRCTRQRRFVCPSRCVSRETRRRESPDLRFSVRSGPVSGWLGRPVRRRRPSARGPHASEAIDGRTRTIGFLLHKRAALVAARGRVTVHVDLR